MTAKWTTEKAEGYNVRQLTAIENVEQESGQG